MKTLPLATHLVSTGSTLAITGLAALALLTMPGLLPAWRGAMEGWLLVVWLCLVARLVLNAVSDRAAGIGINPILLAVDVLVVVVPLAGALGAFGTVDPPLYVAIWFLIPLRRLTAFQLVWRVLANERRNLVGVFAIFVMVLFASAFLEYLFEREAQPQLFGSIPDAMWWAVTTLTTTGYGDAVPLSPMGRILAGFVMLCGIGVFALWAGILANGFSEEIRRNDFASVWQVAAQFPLFAGVRHADLAEIVRALKPRRLPQGAVICRKGEPGTEMFFILEGQVRILSERPTILGAGDYFGEVALVTGGRRQATVRSETAVSMLALHISDFQRIFGQDSEVAQHIRATAAARTTARTEPPTRRGD